MSKNLFENITNDEAATLAWILHNDGSCAADYFFDDPTVDGRVEELIRHKLAKEDIAGALTITELGRAALKEHEYSSEKQRRIEKQREEELFTFKSIAESAKLNSESALREVDVLKEQLNIYKEHVQSSEKEAKFSKILSVLSTIISLGSLIVAIIALLQ